MFTRILCATDGSEPADRALRYAAELTRHEGGELHIAHVIERLLGGRMSGQNVFLNEAEVDDKIKAQTARLTDEYGVSVTLHMTKGDASHVAQRLSAIADAIDADLIVVGTRGHSSLGGLILGSVTQRLLHATRRPVLALPPPAGSHRHPAPPQRLKSAA